jgi:AcrR family transcriptional regulator
MPPRTRTVPRKMPKQQRSKETVDVILAATARVLVKEGFDRASTNRIADAAGVSIGSLYQYFPTKDAVTIALIERESTTLVEDVLAALALADPKKALRAMIKAAVRNQLRRPKLARMLDFEEARLFAVLPPSRNAGTIRTAFEKFLERSYGLSAAAAKLVAVDVLEIARALNDAGGRREQVDAAALERAVEAAVLGYLTAMTRTKSKPR